MVSNNTINNNSIINQRHAKKQAHVGPTYSQGDAENARPENDGQRKLLVWKKQDWKMTDKNYGVWKMQHWKMTDNILANSEQNYGVWKMQEYKSSRVQPTHTVYIKEAVRDTLQSSTGMSCPLCCRPTPIDMVMRVYF